MYRFQYHLIILFVITMLYMPSLLFAQTAQGGFAPLSGSNFGTLFGGGTQSTPSLQSVVQNIFKIALTVGGILAILRIAYAGYQYMSSDAWGEKSHAKEILGDVIIGLLLLMSIWLILNQINPDILRIRLTPITS